MCKSLIYVQVLVLFLVGCGKGGFESVAEIEEKHYKRAQQLLKEGRNEDAFKAFQKVIEKRKIAPESYLEVGRLYLSLYNDPIFAIYNFRQFLILNPNSKQAPMVAQMIETAKKEFARQIPNYSQDSADYLGALQMAKTLEKENLTMKQEIAGLQAELDKLKPQSSYEAPYGIPGNELAEKETLNHVEATYTVAPGDTLSRISLKIYGTANRWNEILKANSDILDNPNSLKINQELKIPPK